MQATAILAIVAIVAALGAVASFTPIHQVSAQGHPFSPPGPPPPGSLPPEDFPGGGQSSNPCHNTPAGSHNPHCQPE
jgi:hypothetical protein